MFSLISIEICALPESAGNCLAYIRNWRYDAVTGHCVEFTYGGCGGNKNNFDSKEKCENYCSRAGMHVPLSICFMWIFIGKNGLFIYLCLSNLLILYLFCLTLSLLLTTIVLYANSLDSDKTPSNSDVSPGSKLFDSQSTFSPTLSNIIWLFLKMEADEKFSRRQFI